MEWLDEFPTMERQGLRDLKKAIDLGFRDFSRAYGDGIEGFFEPLLYFVDLIAVINGLGSLSGSITNKTLRLRVAKTSFVSSKGRP